MIHHIPLRSVLGPRSIPQQHTRTLTQALRNLDQARRTVSPAAPLLHRACTRHNALALPGQISVFTRISFSDSVASRASGSALTGHNTQEDKEGKTPSTLTTPATSSSSEAAAVASDTPIGFEGYQIRWKEAKDPTLAQIVPLYLDLSKARLAALVTLTTMCGYALAPAATDLPTLFALTAGTGLCIASANTYNQFVEPPYDAQMTRTRNRILVRKSMSPLHAWLFGSVTGFTGTALLAAAVNPLTAALGLSNLVLYAGVYTPMKRMTIANTWVGAIVGGIPPMMGWAAATGSLEPGAWVLGALLYAWQFPHFNALAWNLRADYSKAGYRMMSVTDPALNARVSLRYSLALVPVVTLAPYLDMTSWWLAVDGNVVNAVMIASAYKFWRQKDDKSARQLFFGSLIYLPIIMALFMFHKKRNSPVTAEQDALPVSAATASATSTIMQYESEEDDDEEYDEDDEEDGEWEEHDESHSHRRHPTASTGVPA
ncbi:Protoheme IX farnesyltransferase, mitochondrial [Actinomortierella ambigua]|uniref:Protoheme IX farnesyltransferase, mitochondrial n=1 Tax=Actinomortierella ambigua TaxID=1343610 RepID=A0A9P6U9W2_9FUNG|nr:Protoheme IX farnesyltransferase, mitochondrial [Actinomortierella ambigua]